MKTIFTNHLKNILGWRIKRKIVVFSVDDYGNVRIDSQKAQQKILENGGFINNRFDKYDSLETNDDLSSLYKVLSSVKDIYGNPAVFTAFTVPCNIDFEKMKANNFSKYEYELLPITYSKLESIHTSAYNNTWKLWNEGIEKNLIHPEFHGREHFNLNVFNQKLNENDKILIAALSNRSLTGLPIQTHKNVHFTGAYKFWDFNENEMLKKIISDGLNQFENVFSRRSKHFNSPGGPEHSILHQSLNKGGIKFIDTPFIKKEHKGKGQYQKQINYLGKRNQLHQTFIVRNCVFEPTDHRGFDWVNFTLKQIEAAFRMHKPAIISSHRVNFSGNIDQANRKKGLKALELLLKKITTKYPDVEFMTSSKLGEIINNSQNKC